MIFDSHIHFWKYDPVRDNWIEEDMGVLKRDFLPADYEQLLGPLNIKGGIAVQADESEEETTFLLKLAEENPFIKGVVGWVDFTSENPEEALAKFSDNKFLKGVRHILQAKEDDFMLDPSFLKGISLLLNFNLTYDVLIYPNQLNAALQLIKKFPEQPFVIDHAAKPNIKNGEIDLWKEKIKKVAEFPNVYCKISGLITEADRHHRTEQDFKPYLDVIFDSFDIDQIFFGSDWPVCNLAGTYDEVIAILENYMKDFTAEEKEAVFYNNARRFYNI